MTEPIKLPEALRLADSVHLGYRVGWQRECAAELRRLHAELATAEYALRSKGYRKSCDISACNCGDQWSHGGNADARLRELSSELHRSPVDMNGKTLLAGLSELVERAEKAEAEVERLRADHATLLDNASIEVRRLRAESNKMEAEVERLREALTEIIRYAKGVHDPHLEELVRDFLKEPK